MTRMVFCSKLQKETEGFEQPPYPGQMGQKVYETISKEAWQLWLNQQTMLINEYRLSMLDPNARKFLADEMERFLFGDGSAKPAGYVPPNNANLT
jgi:Fe-S cluster biosynthesis and repair protein YggX